MPKPAYTVLSDTSTRASADPRNEADYGTWLHFAAGDTVTSWPDHAPVDEWVESGHWAPAAKKGRKAGEPSA